MDPSRSVWATSEGDDDWTTWRLQQAAAGDELGEAVMDKPTDSDWTGVRPLGSGSDYTAFLQRYGVSWRRVGTVHNGDLRGRLRRPISDTAGVRRILFITITVSTIRLRGKKSEVVHFGTERR
jgi:hypothetical protein